MKCNHAMEIDDLYVSCRLCDITVRREGVTNSVCDRCMMQWVDDNCPDELPVQIKMLIGADQTECPPPSRGLGDTIAKITKATGIDKLVKQFVKDDCGCNKRREQLNQLLPYGSKDATPPDDTPSG